MTRERAYPPSWYAATAHPAPDRPALAGDADCDVAIVGAGYTGLSTALALAGRNVSVRLLEARKVGWGSSGRNGGQAIQGLRKGAHELAARFGDDQARALLDVAGAARDHFWALIAQHGVECDARRGHLAAAADPGDMRHLADEAEAFARLTGDQSLRCLSAAEVAEAVGTQAYHGGLFDPGSGHVHPLNLALGLARAAEVAGAVLHEDSRVTRVTDGRVETARGAVRCRHVVLAVDGAIGALVPALAKQVMTIGNFAVATEPLADETILPADWAVADTRFVLDYFRRSADGRLLFSGGERYFPGQPKDIAAFVRPHLERVFPQAAGVRIDFAWGGDVAVTRSRFAAVGRQGNMIYAHGYSGQGVMLATFMGSLIAEALLGDGRRFDLLASLPTPPFPGGRALRAPLQVAGMLWYALRDRL